MARDQERVQAAETGSSKPRDAHRLSRQSRGPCVRLCYRDNKGFISGCRVIRCFRTAMNSNPCPTWGSDAVIAAGRYQGSARR